MNDRSHRPTPRSAPHTDFSGDLAGIQAKALQVIEQLGGVQRASRFLSEIAASRILGEHISHSDVSQYENVISKASADAAAKIGITNVAALGDLISTAHVGDGFFQYTPVVKPICPDEERPQSISEAVEYVCSYIQRFHFSMIEQVPPSIDSWPEFDDVIANAISCVAIGPVKEEVTRVREQFEVQPLREKAGNRIEVTLSQLGQAIKQKVDAWCATTTATALEVLGRRGPQSLVTFAVESNIEALDRSVQSSDARGADIDEETSRILREKIVMQLRFGGASGFFPSQIAGGLIHTALGVSEDLYPHFVHELVEWTVVNGFLRENLDQRILSLGKLQYLAELQVSDAITNALIYFCRDEFGLNAKEQADIAASAISCFWAVAMGISQKDKVLEGRPISYEVPVLREVGLRLMGSNKLGDELMTCFQVFKVVFQSKTAQFAKAIQEDAENGDPEVGSAYERVCQDMLDSYREVLTRIPAMQNSMLARPHEYLRRVGILPQQEIAE